MDEDEQYWGFEGLWVLQIELIQVSSIHYQHMRRVE